MKRAILLACLIGYGSPAQTVPEQKQMRQILENLAQARPEAEQQVDWDHLHIPKARNLPDYASLSTNQQAAFRKAVRATLRPHLRDLKAGPGLVLEGAGVQFRFRKTPQGLKLTAIL
ncbi:MAG: hypothetical protein KF760_24845 [Candidatus Eremiobacteraeota bacterium]|nr:hypothetical protein [Candidatus Eremiobacteraeota bacterium]MCW5871896.1 hypothetical protein [Candidatus Eremiobacteraeota bacterium]